MTDRRAISGSLVDAKNIAVHKTVRLSIDVPAEHGATVIAMFGWPTMAAPVAVAVARLADTPQIEAQVEQPAANSNGAREHGPWHTLTATTQAVLRCKTEAFWRFLREEGQSDCNSEDQAATYVRLACGVNTRSHLTGAAAKKWAEIDRRYEAWLRTPA